MQTWAGMEGLPFCVLNFNLLGLPIFIENLLEFFILTGLPLVKSVLETC